MIYDLLTLGTYFSQFNGMFGIADFVYGNTDDILNRKNKIIVYPCLWLELMDEKMDMNGYSFFNIRLTLQHGTPNQTIEDDRIQLNNLRTILKQVIKKMQQDSPAKLVYYHPKINFYYKERFANDNELLAMVETEIGGIPQC